MDGTTAAALLGSVVGIVLAVALGVVVWRMESRERRGPPPGHRQRAFPLPPRFGLALPGFLAWVLVMILACAFALAGAGPGVLPGVVVSAALLAPFAAFGWLHVRRCRDYRCALEAGELDGWRGAILRAGRSPRPGFWETLAVVLLVSVLVVLPIAIVVAGAFGVACGTVRGGLVALAVVLPIPISAGAWLVPAARNAAERRRELEGAASSDET